MGCKNNTDESVQTRNRLTDIENKHIVMKEEREGGGAQIRNMELTDKTTVRKISNKDLRYNRKFSIL